MAKLIMVVAMMMMMMIVFERSAASDISSDQAECTNQLVGLSTCLPYVQGNAKAPTPDCCNGLKEVLSKSPKCLCVLIKDRNDPQLGFKINVSLALALPDSCSIPARIYECPKLLKLPPNSTEAQIFMQPRKAVHGGAANETATVEGNNSTVANESSDGMSQHMGRRKWLRVEKFGEFLSLIVLPLLML